MSKGNSGLGRGLAALLGDEANEGEQQQASSAITEIEVDLIDANPWQPRKEFNQEELDELAASITAVGIITPLTLRKIEETGRYQIIAGERRYRAAKQTGLKTVPAYIKVVSDDKMLAVALIENIQRSNLNPMEEAQSYQRLIEDCHLTQETLADQVGKKRSTVANYLRLLKLPEEIQKGLRDKVISMGHARAIMGVDDTDTQLMLYREIVESGYSVRRIEEMVREYNSNDVEAAQGEQETTEAPKWSTARKGTVKTMPEEYRALCEQLTGYFGTGVKTVRNAKGKGKITIDFNSDEELQQVLERLDVMKESSEQS